MTRNGCTPNADAKHPWPAREDNDPRDTQRRSATPRRTVVRSESPRWPMRRQTRRLDASRAQRSDARPDGPPSCPVLPPMPGPVGVPGVAGLAARLPASAWHGDCRADPPGTARLMTVHSERLACPQRYERAVTGARHPTSMLGRLEGHDFKECRRGMVRADHPPTRHVPDAPTALTLNLVCNRHIHAVRSTSACCYSKHSRDSTGFAGSAPRRREGDPLTCDDAGPAMSMATPQAPEQHRQGWLRFAANDQRPTVWHPIFSRTDAAHRFSRFAGVARRSVQQMRGRS
jgi:hypothetical protein